MKISPFRKKGNIRVPISFLDEKRKEVIKNTGGQLVSCSLAEECHLIMAEDSVLNEMFVEK